MRESRALLPPGGRGMTRRHALLLLMLTVAAVGALFHEVSEAAMAQGRTVGSALSVGGR
jgi:hypothetical protein